MSDLVTLATEYRDLIRASRQHQVQIDRETVAHVLRLLQETARALHAELQTIPRGTLGARYKRHIAASIERHADDLKGKFTELLNGQITAAAANAAGREAGLLSALMKAKTHIYPAHRVQAAFDHATIDVEFGRVPATVLDRLYARTYKDGLKLSQRLYNLDQDTRRALSDTIFKGVAAGASSRKIAASIEPILTKPGVDNVRYKAMRIARTETNLAYREGHIAAVTGGDGKLKPWVNAIGWRLSPAHPRIDICDAWAGDDSEGLGAGNYSEGNVPPGHPHCFPAGTIVTAPKVEASVTRWFDGEVVDIETTGGHFLTVTPNHPILTSHGWVAAGSLYEGCVVIGCRDAERVARLIDPHDYHIPSRIEDIAEAFSCACGMPTSTVPGSAEDFHGDGIDGQISIINTDGLLGHGIKSTLQQPLLKQQFVGRTAELLNLTGLSDLGLVFSRIALAAPGLVGSCGNSLPLTGRDLIIRGLDCRLSVSDVNAAAAQELCNWRARASIATRQALDGLATELRIDNIVRVVKRQFSGHVYNLQTAGSWYTANGIIAHNCLCYTVTILHILPDQQFVMHAPKPDEVPASQRRYYDAPHPAGSSPAVASPPAGGSGTPKGAPKPVKSGKTAAKPKATASSAPAPATVKRMILAREKQIRPQRFETIYVVDQAGNVILDKNGAQYSVTFTTAETQAISQAPGVVATHNHPRGWGFPVSDPQHQGNSFSDADIDFATKTQMAEIRAITPTHRYSMKPGPGGWDAALWTSTIKPSFDKHVAAVTAEFQQAIARKTMTPAEAAARHWHEVWTRVSKEVGLRYSRHKG